MTKTIEEIREDIENKIFLVIQYVYAEPEWARQDSYKIAKNILAIKVGGEVVIDECPNCHYGIIGINKGLISRPRTVGDCLEGG